MIYDCKKCGKTFKQKSNYTYHIGRTRPCIIIDKVIQEHVQTNNINNTETVYKQSNVVIEEVKSSIYKNTKENGYRCKICNKIYKFSQSLTKHKQKHINEIVSTEKIEISNIKKENIEIKKEIEELKMIINNKHIIKQNIKNQNNNIHNTINNTINIIGFGREELKKLSTEDKKKILFDYDMDPLLEIIEKTHFNEEIPEQNNIKYTNMKLKYLEIHNGKIWQKELVSKIIDELIDNSLYKLQELIDICNEKFKEKIRKSVPYNIKLYNEYVKVENNELEVDEKKTYLKEKEIKQNMNEKKEEVKLLLHNKTKEIYK